MKKLFSISFAFLILLSGMHFSLATHFCGGEVKSVKLSFSGQKATCGMEDTKNSCPSDKVIGSNCCHNKLAFFSVDNNYSLSSFQVKEPCQKIIQILFVPVSVNYNSIITSTLLSSNVNPPGELLTSFVSLTNICVFRI
jgi:hypothetical protein